MSTSRRPQLIWNSIVNKRLSSEELCETISKLRLYFLPISADRKFNKMKKKTVRQIQLIIKRTPPCSLRLCERIDDLLQACFITVFYFQMNIQFFSRHQKKQEKRYLYAVSAADALFKILLPERLEELLKHLVAFLDNTNFWIYRHYSMTLFSMMCDNSNYNALPLKLVLQEAQLLMDDDEAVARQRMLVFHGLVNAKSSEMSKEELHTFITYLMTLFTSARHSNASYKERSHLRKSFELCFRVIYSKVENRHRAEIIKSMLQWYASIDLDQNETLEFSDHLTGVSRLYVVGDYTTFLGTEIINTLFNELVLSNSPLDNMIGCQVVRLLLDRHRNSRQLEVPSIYHSVTESPITVGKLIDSDRQYMINQRALFHDAVMTGMRTHADRLDNLLEMFALVSCIVVEVPCGFTAAEASWIAVALQDIATNDLQIADRSRYWFHVLAISLMSLICWVHKADALEQYITKIINSREMFAQYLNPPIRIDYSNIEESTHTSQFRLSNIFIEDWEVRYRLWKHFIEPAARR